MEGKDISEHLLALKVMRLTRPSLCSPLVVSGYTNSPFNSILRDDVTAVTGIETLNSGQLLLLPQSFGNIYLGETFSSYICVQNDSDELVTDICVKADLQTSSQRIPLIGIYNTTEVPKLFPQQTVDDVVYHEVKEIGNHILVCDVNYSVSTRRLSFRKFFTFQVLKPLDVKTKFYSAESDEVYLEAQVQNITSGPMFLESVSLESSAFFTVSALNFAPDGSSVHGPINMLQPFESEQFLYCLVPSPASDQKVRDGPTIIGKLDIVWRTNMGGRGHLQTSQLERMAPLHDDVRMSLQEVPNIVHLEEEFTVVCKITNVCERPVDLLLDLQPFPNLGLAWNGVSGRRLGKLGAGACIQLTLRLIPLALGLQNITGIRLADMKLNRMYEYNDLSQVFVIEKSELIYT